MMDTRELAWRIRRHAVEMTHISNGSHIGAVLSIADIIGVLYGAVMRVDPNNPNSNTRDRFILSKGHAGAAVYAALAECGFFPVEELLTHYADGSRLSGHISHKNVPGVEFSTGSLGHGINVACGMAFAGKLDQKQHRVYVVIGDGECNEGSVWEAALFAAHQKIKNLTVIIDHNRQQGLGRIEKIMDLGNLSEKWVQFGWYTQEIDGHDHSQLIDALTQPHGEKPTCIIAKTIKGKGISFMEDNLAWHYKSPQGNDYSRAVKELEAARI